MSLKSIKLKKAANEKLCRLAMSPPFYGISREDEQYLLDNLDKFRYTSLRLVYETIYLWIDYDREIIWVIEDHSANGIYCGPKPTPFLMWDIKIVKFSEFTLPRASYGCNPFQYIGKKARSILVFDRFSKIIRGMASLESNEWERFLDRYKPKPPSTVVIKESNPDNKPWWRFW